MSACFFSPPAFNEDEWMGIVEATDHQALYKENYQDGRYHNPWLHEQNRSFWRFLRWRLSKSETFSKEAQTNLPDVVPDLLTRIEKLDAKINFITWIGHATFLFRIDGVYWLTDPMFSERALLPKRITPPALDIHDLHKINATFNIVISHNHYDHMDKNSLRNLPEKSTVFVPQGLGDYVRELTKKEVREMNWWDEIQLSQTTKLVCLPAQHWSMRISQGYNRTLWASFLIQTESATVYFGGDSGYFKGYREIGLKYPSIDYALLPITAYEPRWFMHYPHMNTKEAIRAFQDLRAQYFIPTQWGTFHLGDNPPGLPPLDLKKDLSLMNLSEEPYLILDLGEIREM